MKDRNAKRLSAELGIPYLQAFRLVDQAKRLARQEKISYPEAEAHVINGRTVASSAPSLTQLLKNAVENACMNMAYSEIEDRDADDRPRAGLPFNDVDLPRGTVENLGVDLIEPDLDTLDWSVDEEYDGGTQAINLTVSANVQFDGYVHKSAAHHLDDDIHVAEFDWNDHMSHVYVTRQVTLIFSGIVEPGLPAVEDLEFTGASDAFASDPHALN